MRLTPKQVSEVRAAYKSGGCSYSGLAALYKVSPTCISDVVNRVSHKAVT